METQSFVSKKDAVDTQESCGDAYDFSNSNDQDDLKDCEGSKSVTDTPENWEKVWAIFAKIGFC